MKTYGLVALLLLHNAVAFAQTVESKLIINEILFAPEDSELEFIELFNRSSTSLDLCAYSFSDERDDISAICEGTTLVQSGGYVVLARNSDLLSTFFSNRTFITPPHWHALNNSGDRVRLYLNNIIVDEVAYQGAWGQRGSSIERVDPEGPSWAAFNWRSSESPFNATPGIQNSVYSPDRMAPEVTFIEAQDANTLFVVFNEPVDPSHLSVDAFRVLQSSPESYTVLTDTTFLLHFESEFERDLLLTRGIRDFTGNQSPARSSPISFVPEPGDLIINEIMYEPLSDDFDAFPNQPEYIELFNATDRHISLRRLTLIGPEDESGVADSLRSLALFPTVGPLQFALLHSSLSTQDLSGAFPSILGSIEPITYLPISSSSLGLLNQGDFAGIAVAGTRIDTLDYSPNWHYPDLVTTRGIALERRSAKAASAYAANWSSSTHPEGGTPGRPNSIHIPSTEMLSEARIHLEPVPFTPDGDGVHDVLFIRVQVESTPQSVKIRIFDSKGRFVNPLVQTAIIGQEAVYIWDGTTSSLAPAPTGMYIVFIELQDVLHNRIQRFKKIVVLARPW